MQNTLEQTDRPIQPTDADAATDTDHKLRNRVAKEIAKRSFATLATSSPAGRPHVAGVIYERVDDSLWVHTMGTSRKARNIAASGHVAASIPFRRLPFGPPYTLQFQTTAELVPMDDPEVLRLLAAGRLKSISGHGALEMTDACFVKIAWPRTVHSFGPGVRLIDLVRDPLNRGGRTVRFDR